MADRVSMEIDSAAAVRDDTGREIAALRVEAERSLAWATACQRLERESRQRAERAEEKAEQLCVSLNREVELRRAADRDRHLEWERAVGAEQRAERAEALLAKASVFHLEVGWSLIRLCIGVWNLHGPDDEMTSFPTLDAALAAYEQSRETTDEK